MDIEAQRQKARADHLEQVLYATQRERDTAKFQLAQVKEQLSELVHCGPDKRKRRGISRSSLSLLERS